MAREILRTEKGVALIIALMMLLILTFIGISAISTTTFETSLSGNERVGTSAFYASEAISHRGINQLPKTDHIDPTEIGEGSYAYGWSGTVKDKANPKDLQYISQYYSPGDELGSGAPSYEIGTSGATQKNRYQINATGESLGAIKEIELQVTVPSYLFK